MDGHESSSSILVWFENVLQSITTNTTTCGEQLQSFQQLSDESKSIEINKLNKELFSQSLKISRQLVSLRQETEQHDFQNTFTGIEALEVETQRVFQELLPKFLQSWTVKEEQSSQEKEKLLSDQIESFTQSIPARILHIQELLKNERTSSSKTAEVPFFSFFFVSCSFFTFFLFFLKEPTFSFASEKFFDLILLSCFSVSFFFSDV